MTRRWANGGTPAARGEDTPNVESRPEQTKKRIRDAAAQVLSAKGYAGFRVTEVAAIAEVQAPAIYYYWASRDELIEEVMWVGTAATRDHTAAVLDALPSDVSAMDRLMAAVEAHLRHVLEMSDYSRAAIRNADQVPPSIRKRQMREENLYGELWRRLLSDLNRSGDMRVELDPYHAQMLILGALNWCSEWWDPRRSSVDTLVADAQSFVRGSIITFPQPSRRRRGQA
ncbi:regulatory protein TetR [Mycolicibacterium rhodesiae JS60]|nr:regulatory protein TetR [Mycolicibacterium rhodesiae JS60]